MSTFPDRIRAALDAADMNQNALANKVGLNRANVTSWLNGSAKSISSDNLFPVAKALNVDPEWLATGKGEMAYKPHLRVIQLEGKFDDDHQLVPKLEIKLSAGQGAVPEENRIGDLAFRKDWFKKQGLQDGQTSVVEVVGDSMEPTLYDGDSILIDHTKIKPQKSKVVAVRVDNDLVVVKRLQKMTTGQWLLCSDNPEYEPIPIDNNTYIIGQVVWRGQNL